MDDCYKIVGVERTATIAEIRRAYRRKAKELHPDTSSNKNAEAFLALSHAYQILMDAHQRKIFDNSFYNQKTYTKRNKSSFDYREWLLSREDDESRAKLIFYDLATGREDEAVAEYVRMKTNRAGFSLKRWYTREDFMDFGFILSEELVIRRYYYDAVMLLEDIIAMEYSYSYFRLFFPEVMSFTSTLLKKQIEGNVNDELALDVWERALDLKFGNTDDFYFLQKMSEAYRRIGDIQTADLCLKAAVNLH